MTVVRVFANKTDFTDPKESRSLGKAFLENMALAICLNSQSKSLYVQHPNALPIQQGNKAWKQVIILEILAESFADRVCLLAVF